MPPRRKSEAKMPQSVDLEEIQPQRFFVREVRARPFLKDEGRFQGNIFELTSWRRDGLLARLRANGFTISTLADQIQALPAVPPAEPIGETCMQPVNSVDRYSFFDPETCAWTSLTTHDHAERRVVSLCAGWVIRRRRGRGTATYYRVFRNRNGWASLSPLSETKALLAGYAQVTQTVYQLSVEHTEQAYIVPDLDLPAPHRDLLRRIAQQTATGWQVDAQNWPLIRQIYEWLGLTLTIRE